MEQFYLKFEWDEDKNQNNIKNMEYRLNKRSLYFMMKMLLSNTTTNIQKTKTDL